MIYLIGGPPRCGKSLLARMLNRERALPVVSTDLLRCVLMKADAELAEAMEAKDTKREAEAFHPYLRQTIACAGVQLEDALLEGIGFLPRHVDRIRCELGIEVRCCFLGRTAATAEDLFGHETEHRVYASLDPAQQAAFADWVVAWSGFYEKECREHDLPFVDVAADAFDASLLSAKEVLFPRPSEE